MNTEKSLMERAVEALESLAKSHAQAMENSSKLIEQSSGTTVWKGMYDKVFNENLTLRNELVSVRDAALRMGASFKKEWEDCHDGSEQACCKVHEGDE